MCMGVDIGERVSAWVPSLAATPSLAPHCGQNAKSEAQICPQSGQAFGCFAPHLGQKVKPLWSPKPQLTHFIDEVLARALAPMRVRLI
jgi:hypothetical protein